MAARKEGMGTCDMPAHSFAQKTMFYASVVPRSGLDRPHRSVNAHRVCIGEAWSS